MIYTFLKKNCWIGMVLILTLAGCQKEDDPAPINEGEEFTTVEFTLTPSSGTPIVISYKDLDGEGGNAPVFTPAVLSLTANTTYTTKLRFLNENESPAEDVTVEIEEESDEHEIFYEATAVNLTFSDYNTDKNTPPLKLGTTAKVATGSASSGNGTLKITLKHKEKGTANQKAAGDTVDKGDTDVEVIFPVEIK